jgi:hypothetical protein
MNRAAVGLAIVLCIGACGSSSSVVKPPANETAAPVGSPAEHVARIDELREKGCACEDRRCLAAIDRELAAMVTALELDRTQAMSPEQAKTSAAKLEELSVCMTTRQVSSPDFGRAIAARYAELAGMLCACPDQACRDDLPRALPEAEAAFFFPLEDDAFTRYEETMNSIGKCGPPTESAQARAIRELTVLRDRACACTDAECAEKVQADFDVFLEDHKDTQGSQSDAETIGALAAEMSGCLQDAMPATN